MNNAAPEKLVAPQTIAICGASGKFGRVLVRTLHRTHRVVAVDPRPFAGIPSDVNHHQSEITRRSTRNLFRKRIFNTVIHVGANTTTDRKGPTKFTRAVENFARLLEYCDEYDVQRLILISSANLYGARAENSQFLEEKAPLLSPDLSSLREIDMMTQSFFWRRPDIETVIFRPVHITGTSNGVLSRYLRHSKVPTLFGFNPLIQLVHEQDLIQAITRALTLNCRGIYNIAGPEPIPLKEIIHKLQKEYIDILHPLAGPVLRHLNQLGKMDIHPAYIDHIRYICMVNDSRARTELGYSPEYDLDKTIEAIELWS